jgi:hypothetical protein
MYLFTLKVFGQYLSLMVLSWPLMSASCLQLSLNVCVAPSTDESKGYKGIIQLPSTRKTHTHTHTQMHTFSEIWLLGGFGWLQNTPTGRGKYLPAPQIQF